MDRTWKHGLRTAAAGAFCGAMIVVGVAQAGTACQFKGQLSMAGVTEVMDDCIQSSGAGEQQLRQFCDQHVAAAREMTQGFGGVLEGEMHWLSQCPSGAQGRCEGYGGMQLDTYYYSRAPEMLESLPQSCSMLGGRWVAGD
ncbi:MAG: hypothetical protein ACXIUZ_09305 [Lysobacteraceae bacterium]